MDPTHHAITELVIGLDFQTVDRAIECVDRLEGFEVLYQVGLELFMNGGPELLRELAHRKKRVFLDLKFLDTPEVVTKAVQQAALLHVEVLSLHLGGGGAVIRTVRQSLEEIPLLRPRLLGVGILDSFDDVKWAEMTRAFTGHALKLSDSFETLLDSAFAWGLDGLVCSAMQLKMVRNLYPNLYTLVSSGAPARSLDMGSSQRLLLSKARELGADAVLIPASSMLSAYSQLEVSQVLGGLGFSSAQV